jgi:hypothetical protein
VFSNKGSVAFADREHLPEFLSLLNSKAYAALLSPQVSFGSYELGVIQRTPVPAIPEEQRSELEKLGLRSVNTKRDLDTSNETSHVFQLPALLQVNGDSLSDRAVEWQAKALKAENLLDALQGQIDAIASHLYGISEEDQSLMEGSRLPYSSPDGQAEDSGANDESEDIGPPTDARQLSADTLSYAVGCALGRWNARFASGEITAPELCDAFAPLPVCAPSALIG